MTWSDDYPSMGLAPACDTWADQYDDLAEGLGAALGPDWILEHVGSTSVPGLIAKPVIDMAIRIPADAIATDSTASFVAAGWTQPHELGDHVVSFLLVDGRRAAIAHVFTAEQWPQAHVRLFASWLRSHPTDRDRYAALKLDLVRRGAWEDGTYTAAKINFVLDVVNRAREAHGLPRALALHSRGGVWQNGVGLSGRYPAEVSDHDFPRDHPGDEIALLLDWLGFLRSAVVRKASVHDRQAHWRPDGRLLSLVGIVNHLTRVEWRWIDGGFLSAEIERTEEEFVPGGGLTIDVAIDAYRERAERTDTFVRSASLNDLCQLNGEEGASLRWVLLHLINETARHAGHADAVRELLDGTTGE